ncbi:MAG TPA: P27 family phage terminase small subunit [Gemmatimonadales bacterium]|nr:P27 family phage terminase small subunit [Gemmatimonadales bacterium]
MALCPEWVCDPGKILWARLAPDLEREGLLTARDAEEFGSYCHERAIYGIYCELLKEMRPRSTKVERYRAIALKANDRAQRTGARFGMTPSDRVGLSVPTKPPRDEEFLFGQKDQP